MNRVSSSLSGRDLATVAVFAGIVAALGLVPAIPALGGAVPITAQSLGVMLAGAILGPRRGALALVVFLALVALGLPLLAGGRGGLGVFAGPSVGYLVGFPIAACAVGALTWAVGAPYRVGWGIVANVVGGVVVLNVLGIAGMMMRADLGLATAITTALVFVPGDLIKAVLCALVARSVHAASPGRLPAGYFHQHPEAADARG
ncbi:biotin transporter BioY [Nocardioides rotundus]|uniref:biotin transporter BioY n=1 Tax=Nocardioides rotundus TaxID=1774216 RepID=UPI001CBD7EB8|nr:biotin transporter BioY [Nocardioides rotundus]UAL29938.1 biotin transporter BioY [Nocardioides rotundus]